MIYLHKILPLFFLPIGLMLCLLIWAAITRKRLPIFLCLGLLLIASTQAVSDGLLRFVEAYAVKQDPASVPIADAVVVLSGTLRPVKSNNGSSIEWTDADRFFAGVELVKANRAKILIFTAEKLPWAPDAQSKIDVLRKYAIALGINPDAILITGEVANTDEEAIAIKQLAEKNDFNRIILVTSAFHMPRAEETFQRRGVKVIAYPVDFKVSDTGVDPTDYLPSADALADTELAMRELMGRAYYRIKGLLSP